PALLVEHFEQWRLALLVSLDKASAEFFQGIAWTFPEEAREEVRDLQQVWQQRIRESECLTRLGHVDLEEALDARVRGEAIDHRGDGPIGLRSVAESVAVECLKTLADGSQDCGRLLLARKALQLIGDIRHRISARHGGTEFRHQRLMRDELVDV